MPKLLIFCPTLRVEPEVVMGILAQKWDGALHVMFTRDNPHPTEPRSSAYLNILHNYQQAWELVLAHDYDALMTIESDVIAPGDAAQKLWATGSPVAFGLVCQRHGLPVVAALRVEGKSLGQSLSFYPDEYKGAWGKIVDVSGIGWCTTLVRREVIEKIKLRVPDNPEVCCDWSFAEDALQLGIKMQCDMSVICGHKTPEGVVLWPPAPDELWRTIGMHKIKITQTVNYRQFRLLPGMELEVDDIMYSDLVRAGYAIDVGESHGVHDSRASEDIPRHKRRKR